MEQIIWTPSDLAAAVNQTLDYAYPGVVVEGEVASFKVNQGKFIFFDLKDEQTVLACFMMLFQMRQLICDGMKVRVVARPQLTKWGKFSLTAIQVTPVGEGDIKESARLLQEKLTKEGLFDSARKRPLPFLPSRIGLISSEQAAGFADFCRILDERFGGIKILFNHTQVQGEAAADQIIAAIEKFNQMPEPPELIALVRGGGSAEDLACFNDEKLVRAIVTSRIPIITGIGHEIDESLSDLAADVRAATPSHAAQMIVPDKNDLVNGLRVRFNLTTNLLRTKLDDFARLQREKLAQTKLLLDSHLEQLSSKTKTTWQLIESYNPTAVLERGYALVRGESKVGQMIEVETNDKIIKAEVINVKSKNN
mgnify:CR=1 FL=1